MNSRLGTFPTPSVAGEIQSLRRRADGTHQLDNPLVPPCAAASCIVSARSSSIRRAANSFREQKRVRLSSPQSAILTHLVSHVGVVISKETLIDAGCGGTAITENSLDQAISRLRKVLGEGRRDATNIETLPQVVHDPADTLCFVCGPRALVSESVTTLGALGAPGEAIRTEAWVVPCA